MRKTKIICTLGPSTDDPRVLRELMLAYMDVARVNMSHQNHESHLRRIQMIKELREELDLPIAILIDTKGPEIRLGTFREPKVQLTPGDPFTLTTRAVEGDSSIASVSFAGLPADVQPGCRILIDDGLIELTVLETTDTDIHCTVVNGGPVSANKGVNVPDVSLSLPFMCDRDRDDIRFACEVGADFIAASFTRQAEDIVQMRQELEHNGNHTIRLIAKIENAEGVDNIDGILKVSDGIMVARGDMGVEIALEEIPSIQKKLIHKGYDAGLQVITATQMLDSMMKNPRPTRAETTDVANAIYDGTSAIMLSGETAAGAYPIEAVRTMARIAERTEQDINYKSAFPSGSLIRPQRDQCDLPRYSHHRSRPGRGGYPDGYQIRRHRPYDLQIPARLSRHLLYHRSGNPAADEPFLGRHPLMADEKDNVDDLCDHAVQRACEAGLLKSGDLVVITMACPGGFRHHQFAEGPSGREYFGTGRRSQPLHRLRQSLRGPQ